MNLGEAKLLANILEPAELESIPIDVQQKLKAYIEGVVEDYCKEKAASYRIGEYEQRTEELQNQIQDYEEKLKNYQQNVAELRSQLDMVSNDRAQLLAVSNTHDIDAVTLRKEKNDIVEERDALLKVIERHHSEEQRMKADIQTYQQQLNTAIAEKCKAIARVGEIESKEVAFQMKERRIEQEQAMMQNEIHMLKEDLNRNLNEIQNLRRDGTMQTMHLDTRLTQKTNELKIVKAQLAQYNKVIEELNESVRNNAQKLMQQKEESDILTDNYKKELQMKSKLIDIYKGSIEDNKAERNELTSAIAELRRLLMESSEQYGTLETQLKAVNLKHEQEMEEKCKSINTLKEELIRANELIKEMQQESVESAISKLAPTAAITSRLIRSDMSLTELYAQYAKATEDLELQKRENSRLNLQMKSILDELNERAPLIEKQQLEYKKMVETNNSLTQQQDELQNKNQKLVEQLHETEMRINHLDRENKKLKRTQDDMFRQMTCLIQEVEQLRIGLEPNSAPTHTGSMKTSDEVITKKLVTYRNVAELQENNQKLLLLVRDLTTKMEEIEAQKQAIEDAAIKEKIESYAKKVQDLEDTLNQKNNALTTVLAKCERYKKMYFEGQKSAGKQANQSQLDNTATEMIDSVSSAAAKSFNAEEPKTTSDVETERKLYSLQQQLNEANEKYKTLKEQYTYYKGEKQNNDKLFQEQFDSMRTEVRHLTSANCKLTNSLEYLKEQKQLLQKNNGTYKQQITALEDRSKNYETTIIKHEQTILMLKDEVMGAQRKAAVAEADSNNLRHENRIIKDTASRLQAEKEIFNREQQSQALLLNNLEFIKSNLERSEAEGRIRIEQRLEETLRESAAQRRHFQEEEDRYRECINDFRRKTETAKKQMEEEKQLADKLRKELAGLRTEITAKATQIDDLSKKLQESLTPTQDDNPIATANKKAREFELKYEETCLEVNSLKTELLKAREHGEQFYKMSHTAESEIKRLHDLHTNYVSNAEEKIEALKKSEATLNARISELEAEIMLANVTEQSKNVNQSDQLKLAQEELKNALQKLSEANSKVRTLRAENASLTEALNLVEVKYANEMIWHSADIQELTKLKAELTKVQDQIQSITSNSESAESAYVELKKSHEKSLSLLQNEKEEYEKRVEDLTALNANLHDQIEALSTKMYLFTSGSNQATPNQSLTALNESATLEASMTEMNQSKLDEDQIRNNEQLLQIIKFLRKEKDLSTAKLDIIKAENVRLVSEHTILQKKVDELNGCLNQERAKTDSNVVSATKHEEILRKIETLNAITDSNRILREERNALSARVTEMKERISSIEEELFPLKRQNGELTSKVDELCVENSSLRTEAMKWRQRANALVEKSNKNPEEFKRLQLERESLAKMLTNEKELQKKANDEIATLKSRLETELPLLSKQVQALSDERRKLNEDTYNVKLNNTRMSQELMDLKTRLLHKEDELTKASEELQSKETQIIELRNKEAQIRKIAKRYKDNYTELSSKYSKAGESVDLGESSIMGEDNGTELENLRAQVESLTSTVNSKQGELDQIQKEFNEVKSNAEVNAQSTELLRDARVRLIALTEARNLAQQELNNFKKLQQANEESIIANAKATYEEKISSLEKDLQEQITLNKETIARLTRENESLHMRINQLNRQLGLQQSSKPSTSSVAITEKGNISETSPRTANVKPMSGSTTVQQSATVPPWRGSETPLASIRPISVQNSRTAAILPTSQQTSAGSSSSNTTSSTSSSSTSSTPSGSSSATAAGGNTALVPPQQQVHTTGSTTLESIASSSPTSSHTDYMPSTSSAAVAVAAVPPMGTTTAAESSQEAESVQQPQQNDAQLYVSGNQPQVVALVSPRVEGSSTTSTSTTTSTTTLQNTTSANISQQMSQQDLGNQQPSTSGGTSSSSIVVSSHSRHTPSSSSVTTTQAGCSSVGHKRPRDVEGDSTNAEESNSDKMTKRLRTPLHGGDSSTSSSANIGDCGIDVDQMPTSSQRDQEDDIVVVSEEEEEEEDVMGDADDDVPMDGVEVGEEGYEDAYEQEDQEIDENEGTEGVNEHGSEIDLRIQDNNEVDIDEEPQSQSQQCTSGTNTDQQSGVSDLPATMAATSEQDNHQQSQAISSGSGETNTINIPQAVGDVWKQASSSSSNSSSSSASSAANARRPDKSAEIVSSPQVSKSADDVADLSKVAVQKGSVNEGAAGPSESFTAPKAVEEETPTPDETVKKMDLQEPACAKDNVEDDEDFGEETGGTAETSELADAEGQPTGSASQSEIQDNQLSQIEANSEDIEGTDGVSSEGEKQTVEGVEEEGREAEATTSPTMNTRSKTSRGGSSMRRGARIQPRGNSPRPTPIIWQDAPGNSRNMHNLRHQDQQQPMNPIRNFTQQRAQRGRRALRRPTGNNYQNMRFQ